jgi:hypothetical protein
MARHIGKACKASRQRMARLLGKVRQGTNTGQGKALHLFKAMQSKAPRQGKEIRQGKVRHLG